MNETKKNVPFVWNGHDGAFTPPCLHVSAHFIRLVVARAHGVVVGGDGDGDGKAEVESDVARARTSKFGLWFPSSVVT
jgi:hypothetical protein